MILYYFMWYDIILYYMILNYMIWYDILFCDIVLYYMVWYSIILYYIILNDIILYYFILYYIILNDIILYYFILYYVIWYYIMWYDIILYYIILCDMILYYVIWYYTILYDILLYFMILYFIMWYDMILYYIIWYDIRLCDMIWYDIILYYILYLPTILLRPSLCGLVLYRNMSMHKLTIYLLEDVTGGVHLISRRINELELRLDEWATISCESSWIKWAENTGMVCLSFAFTSEAYLTYIIYHHTSYIYTIYIYICIYIYDQLLGRFIPLRLVEHLKDLAQWDGGYQKAWYRNMNRMVLRAMFNMNMYIICYITLYIYILYIDYIQPLTKSTIIQYSYSQFWSCWCLVDPRFFFSTPIRPHESWPPCHSCQWPPPLLGGWAGWALQKKSLGIKTPMCQLGGKILGWNHQKFVEPKIFQVFLGMKMKKEFKKKDLWKQQTALVNSSLEPHVSGSMFQWHPTVAKGSPMPLLYGSDHLISIRNWIGKYHGIPVDFLCNQSIDPGTVKTISSIGMWGDHKSDTWTQPIHFSTAPPANSCTGHNKARWSLGTWGRVNIGPSRRCCYPRRSSLNSSLVPFHRAVSSFVSQSHPHLLTLRSFRRYTAWGGMEWKSRAVWKGMGAGPWG